jgi:hypothetical protein
MAVQMQVSHSSIMRGVGLSRVCHTYDCDVSPALGSRASLSARRCRLRAGIARQDSRRGRRSGCHRRSRGDSSAAKGVVTFRI